MALRFRRLAKSYAAVSDAAALRLSTYTVTLAFRFDTAPSGSQVACLLAKGGTNSAGTNAVTPVQYALVADYSGGHTRLRYLSHQADGTVNSYASALDVVPGRWYDVALTSNGTAVHLYATARRHGAEVKSATAYAELGSGYTLPGAAATSTDALRFGASTTGAGVLCDGADVALDNVAVYSAVISTGTLNGRLGLRLSGNETSLVSYWPMDDGLGGAGGSTAYDRGPAGPTVTVALHSANSWGSPDVSERVRFHPGHQAHVLALPYQYRYARWSATDATGRNAALTNTPTWTTGPTDLYYHSGTAELAFLGVHSWTRSAPCLITASDENANYPAAALRSGLQATYYRTNDATGAKTVTFDFGYPVPVWAITAYGTVLGTGAGYQQAGTIDWWFGAGSEYAAEMSEVVRLSDPSEHVETVHRARTSRDLSVSADLEFRLDQVSAGFALWLRDLLRQGMAGPYFACPDVRLGLYGGSCYGWLSRPPSMTFDPAFDYASVGPLGLVSDRP